MIKIDSNEIAIVGDLHLGNNLNSEKYQKIALDYAVWLEKTLTSKGIKDVIFLGDIFHNREEIGTRTLQVAHDFFDTLKSFNIGIILGNHDLFYHDTTDVSSVSIFRGWKNIHVFHKTSVVEFGKKKLGFIPWGFKAEEVPTCDYMFGHFELSSFKMNMYKICEHGGDLGSLWNKSPLIFSGHFHCRQERESDGKVFIYAGSCYEQNWGEMDNNKGIYLLDLNTAKYEFIKNDVSPIHIKQNLSDILRDKERLKAFTQLVKNNFIKLVIDSEIDVDKVEKLTTKVGQLNPLDFTTEFAISTKVKSAELSTENISLDIRTLIQEYVKVVDTTVNKDKLLAEVLGIYDKAFTELN